MNASTLKQKLKKNKIARIGAKVLLPNPYPKYYEKLDVARNIILYEAKQNYFTNTTFFNSWKLSARAGYSIVGRNLAVQSRPCRSGDERKLAGPFV